MNVIHSRLLPILEAWILPNGACGWCSPAALVERAEPLCSALNLLRLLVLREDCQVRHMEACAKISQQNAATWVQPVEDDGASSTVLQLQQAHVWAPSADSA